MKFYKESKKNTTRVFLTTTIVTKERIKDENVNENENVSFVCLYLTRQKFVLF